MDRTSISVSSSVLLAFNKGKIAHEYKTGKKCSNDLYMLHLLEKSIGKNNK